MNEFTNLVDPDRIRSAIRRLFSGSVHEILGELLQNSQRAGAGDVVITTDRETGRMVYADDGHGLDDMQDFHALLMLGASNFQREQVAFQHPMGLGIHALLAHEDVQAVTFRSGGYQLRITTAEWWNNQDYYESWYTRMENLDVPHSGMRIEVAAHPGLIEQVENGLTSPYNPWNRVGEYSPARGYTGWLRITLNGADLETSVPKPHGKLIMADVPYAPGTTISVWVTNDFYADQSLVLWYGQIIRCTLKHSSRIQVVMDVRAGRPVNPMAPSRQGIIQDEAWSAVQTWIADQIREYLLAQPQEQIDPEVLQGYASFDPKGFTTLPYFLVQEYQEPGDVDVGDYEDLERYGALQVVSYDEPPLLLRTGVWVPDNVGWQHMDYGLPTFLKIIGPAAAVVAADDSRVTVKSLYWMPGDALLDVGYSGEFAEPGVWGLSGDADEEPEHWSPVDVCPVLAFAFPAHEIDTVDFVAAADDRVRFLEDWGWAMFDGQSDEHAFETIQDWFTESLARIVRDLLGNCVPHQFSLHDLAGVVSGKILTITVEYDEEQPHMPVALQVTTEEGQKRVVFR